MRLHALALGLCLTAAAFATLAQDTRRGYIIQLADAPAATYGGGVPGLAATRPAPGRRLNVNASDVQAYIAYLDNKAAAMAASAVPGAPVYARYAVAFNGFAARLTDAEARKLASTPGVAAITVDEPRQLDTATTPTFLGLTNPVSGIWNRTDAQGRVIKGEDVIIGHIDGGVWPENPSFSDKVDANGKPVPYYAAGTQVYGAPPAKWTGICQPGLGFTAAMCNNKLIGARFYNAGWKANRTAAQLWAFEYLDSPRDADGHGSHTLSTSGGNENVDGNVGGAALVSGISGMAPRARVASYKVCYNGNNGPGVAPSGCFNSDSVAAINQAVADGVDVINYSISGSQTSFVDPVETAFRNAAFAGVFVAASAGNGNSFPGNAPTVAHNSPWIMTVGNSTHDRFLISTLTLGDGQTFTGAAGISGAAIPNAPVILSSDAALPGANATAANLCFSTSWNGGVAVLDPAKVAGKIVVCDRGTNDRVDKSRAVREAGGVGLIHVNTSPGTLNNDSHSIPAVHLQNTSRAAVRAYAALPGATAASTSAVRDPNVIAPVMSNSSSRGPNQADADMLKPDITAPGTDIIAAYANRGLTLAQRDEIAAGNFAAATPYYDIISGTSMSSPHIAGMAALLRQANPSWTPYAIKSALMTSATQTVKLAGGAADPSPFGYGAGHANPNAALDTTVVYDTTNADHSAYVGNTIAGGRANLNVASMTRANSVGAHTFTRTLTNRGTVTQTFTAAASLAGANVVVTPATLTLAPGESKSFTVTVTNVSAPVNTYLFGNVTWTRSDGANTLRSPLTMRFQVFQGLAVVEDTRAVGTKVWTVATGFNGPLVASARGLAPAVRTPASVTGGGAPTEQCAADIEVPAGARRLRAQTFNSETEGGAATDIDLYLYRIVNGSRTQVGASESGTTNELIQVINPAAGTYRACVVGFAPNVPRSTVINTFVLGPTGTTLRAFGASNVVAGGVASVGAAWNVPAGNRYYGIVEMSTPAITGIIGTTEVFINTLPATPNSGGVEIIGEGGSKASR
jgi:subtilisin family serine protease